MAHAKSSRASGRDSESAAADIARPLAGRIIEPNPSLFIHCIDILEYLSSMKVIPIFCFHDISMGILLCMCMYTLILGAILDDGSWPRDRYYRKSCYAAI